MGLAGRTSRFSFFTVRTRELSGAPCSGISAKGFLSSLKVMALGKTFRPLGVDFDAELKVHLEPAHGFDFFARRHADFFDLGGARADDHFFIALLRGPDGGLDEARTVGPGLEFVEGYLD